MYKSLSSEGRKVSMLSDMLLEASQSADEVACYLKAALLSNAQGIKITENIKDIETLHTLANKIIQDMRNEYLVCTGEKPRGIDHTKEVNNG